MLKLVVLSLSASCALCLSVTPEMLAPIKEFNEACGYDACPVPLSETGINVHIVPHTHYELGFERTFAEHYTGKDAVFAPSKVNMKQTLDSVITELWAQTYRRILVYDNFFELPIHSRFALADIPYFFHWWSQRDDTVRQMVYSLIRQGRLVFIGGGWSMADEAATDYHAIIDTHTFSLRKINATFWKCGRPLVAWQADVMGHSREFASLAAQMGYDALFINPISFDDELARMRRWALEMLWRGSDDLGPRSDIYTHKLFDGYWSPPGFCFSSLCEDPLIVKTDSVLSNVEERVKSFVDSMYNRQAPNYNTSHVMVMMGHINGYFDAPMWFGNIDSLISEVNARSVFGKPKMYLFYSTPACFAKAVHDSNIVLETKQDDFFPVAYDKNSYLTGLYTSCPSIKYMSRIAMVYLQMCKQLSVLAEIGPHHNKLFEELNWIVGAFHDHSIITGSMKDIVKSYYIEKHYIAIQRSTVLLREAWNKLRKCPSETIYYRCSFNVSRCHQLIGNTYFVQIYNPLAWAVTIPVRLPMQCFEYGFDVFDPKGSLINSATMIIPYPVLNIHSRTNASNCEVVFIAENLPPLGFRGYFIQRILPDPNQPKVKRESTDERQVNQVATDRRKVKREATGVRKVKLKATDERKVKLDATDEKYKTQVTNGSKIMPEAINDKKIKQENTNNRKVKLEVTDEKNKTQVTNGSKIIPEATDTEKVKQGVNDEREVKRGATERPKRTLIKQIHSKQIEHMKRKPNKKYLIRQTNPQFDDQTLLYDMDYDDTSTINPIMEKENVSMLLESDGDELRMQEISDIEEDPLTRKTIEPELVKVSPSTTMATEPVVDDDSDIEAQNWNKVMMNGKKGLDDIIKDMRPERTSTSKYLDEPQKVNSTENVQLNFTETRRTEISNQSQKDNMKEIISDREGMHDIAETLLEQIKMTTEGEVSEEEEVTEEPIEVTSGVEAAPMEITTSEAITTTTATKTTTEKEIAEKQKKQYQEDLKKDIERKMFDVGNVNNTYIENKYIRVIIDPASSKISGVTLSNGVHVDLDIQFYFYASDDPVALDKTDFKKPGAYLFRAMENTAIPILDFIDVQVYKTEVVEEAHMVYSDWTSFVIRVYDESPVIEVEWLVGPVPIADKLGKEVFIRYLTDLVHDGVFYTDSSGRQNIKRIRNLRPQFEPLNLDQVAGNFYPVTSKISIQDPNSRVCFSVFTDRAQGGASLADGEVDLMIHRRILTDDTGAGTFVNDTELGKGVAVRGKHYLYISKIDHIPYRIFEKKFAKELHMAPQVLISRPDPYKGRARLVWSQSKNEMSFLKSKLPIGVHIVTLEHWNDNTLLLRLENYLEKSDSIRSPIKTVFITELFTNIYINSVKETTLAANMWLEDYKPPVWNKKENFVKNFNGFYGVDREPEFLSDEEAVKFENVELDKGITLAPQQIRTFVCWFDYIEL